MSTRELLDEITAAAAKQHGLIHLSQFPDDKAVAIRRMAARGALEHLLKGVYRVRGAPTTWMQSVVVFLLDRLSRIATYGLVRAG